MKYVESSLLFLLAVSCGNTPSKNIKSVPTQAVQTYEVIDTLPVSSPFRLCEITLTNDLSIMNASGEDDGTYDNESTPAEMAFFVPEADVAEDELCGIVALRYNYLAVMNRVVHAHDLYYRKITEVDDSLMTRLDTLRIIAEDQPQYESKSLAKYIKDPAALREARIFLDAYRKFDGDEDALAAAFDRYTAYFETLPKLASKKLFDEFEMNFWKWYDKKQFVPGIDDIIRQRTDIAKGNLPDEQCDHLESVCFGETDIDRRAIFAIELGFQETPSWVLGEIIESGIYTRYLLELWLIWRPKVQQEWLGLSSFSTIPNDYYDMVRVKCINTILRHMQTSPDKYDACLLEKFIEIPILHRMACLYGNESIIALSELQYNGFVDPDLR